MGMLPYSETPFTRVQPVMAARTRCAAASS